MKKSIKNTAFALSTAALLSTNAFAATDSLIASGTIAKAVAVTFDVENMDLADMTGVYEASFTVVANTDYTVSVPATGVLTGGTTGATLDYALSASKADSKITLDPADISATQAADTYATNITLTVSAV